MCRHGRQQEDLERMSKIAFLGLGVMGYPMAGHIAAAGHEVTVYNRTTARVLGGVTPLVRA